MDTLDFECVLNSLLTKDGSDVGHIKEAELVSISINLAIFLLKVPNIHWKKRVYIRTMVHYIHVPLARA